MKKIHAIAAWRDARGIVLPMTLFFVALLLATVAALVSVGAMESQISANLLRGTQALDLAEAGAERAIAQFVANPTLVGNSTCSPTCTLFAAQVLNLGQTTVGNTVGQNASLGTYTVTYEPMGPSTVLVRSTGQSAIGNLTQQVQLVVTVPAQNPFAIAADDTQISGSARITGTGGKAHGNTKMAISGSGWVDQTATSTGTTCTGCTNPVNVGNVGGSGTGKPSQTLPTASPLDYKAKADFIMGDDGKIYDQAGTVLADCGTAPSPGCTSGQFAGWYTNVNGKNPPEPGNWHYNGSGNPPNGMYYASWELSIDSSPGTEASPWKATLISGDATKPGELELLGATPYILPYYQDLLGVGGRVTIQGTGVYSGKVISSTKSRPGVTKHDALTMTGATLNGQILADGVVQISATSKIIYNPSGGGLFGAPQILSWTRLAK